MFEPNERSAVIVVDLGYGDSGKGSMVDWLASKGATLTVRFNGGCQAGHGVVAPDGRRHVFAQFGAGMFTPGNETILSRHMLVSPLALLAEEAKLHEKGVPGAMARTQMSEDALVITLFHRAVNRLSEIARGDGRHGSCGMGIGETAKDALVPGQRCLRLRDLKRGDIRRLLLEIQERKRNEAAELIRACRGIPEAAAEIAHLEDPEVSGIWLERIGSFISRARIVADDAIAASILSHQHVAFEGAQGVLLDEWRGFHPYTTWSTCTFDNAHDMLLESGWNGEIVRMGVTRAYATRHGAGPFPTHDAAMTAKLPDADNHLNDWQREFRTGPFDAVTARYAIAACGGIDVLAVTNLDRAQALPSWHVCDAYDTPQYGGVHDLALGTHGDLEHQEFLTSLLADVRPIYRREPNALAAIDNRLGRPKRLIASYGPTANDKRVIR